MMLFSAKKNIYLNDPDVLLMLKFKAGDKKAFESLLKKYFPLLLNFIYRFTANRELSEDIAQEVFLSVYNNGYRYKPKAKFKTWIYQIARNLAINAIKKEKKSHISLDTVINNGNDTVSALIPDKKSSNPSNLLLEKELKAQIKSVIQSLPINQKTALILRRYDQLSYSEIAKIMNISDKAVKSLLSRAKEGIRKKLIKNINK